MRLPIGWLQQRTVMNMSYLLGVMLIKVIAMDRFDGGPPADAAYSFLPWLSATRHAEVQAVVRLLRTRLESARRVCSSRWISR